MSEERNMNVNVDQPRASVPAIADVILERYRLGELPRSETERIEHLLSQDESLRTRLEYIDRSNEELRRELPPDWLARRVAERVRDRRAIHPPRRRSAPTAWAVSGAVAAMIAFVWLRPDFLASFENSPRESRNLDPGDDRSKGAPVSLVIYRNTETGSETLSDNDAVREGDLIRLAYRSAAPAYGTILSVDGRGLVTLHLPVVGPQAVLLGAGKIVLLDRAFELDDAPVGEFFFLITGPAPFDLAVARNAVLQAAAEGRDGAPSSLRLPSPLKYMSLSLRKETK
jgi:hypothetical protein